MAKLKKIKPNEYNLGPTIRLDKTMLNNFDVQKSIDNFNKKYKADFLLFDKGEYHLIGERFTNIEIGDILQSLFIDKNFNESIQKFIISKNVQTFWTEFLNEFIEYNQTNDLKTDIPTNFAIEVKYLQ